MGEHDTWWNLLGYLPGWNHFVENMEIYLGRGPGSKIPFAWGPLGDTEFGIAHVLSAMMVALFLIVGAVAYTGAL